MPIIFQIFAQYLSTLFAGTKHPLQNISQKFLILSVCMYVQGEYLTILHSLTLPIDFGSRAWCIFLGFKSLVWRLWAILHPELENIKSREDIWLCFCYLSVINHQIFCNQTENCFYRAVMHDRNIYWCNWLRLNKQIYHHTRLWSAQLVSHHSQTSRFESWCYYAIST